MEPVAPLDLVDALLRGALIAVLLLLAATLWRERLGPRARTALWLPFGVAVQTVASMPAIEWHVRPLLQAPLVAVSVGNAVLFWLFVKALFDDEFVPRRIHAAAWAAAALLGLFNAGYVVETRSSLAPWSFGVQRVLPLVCTALALWEALRHWQADLVEPRRRLRGFIVGLGGFYTVLQVALRMAGDGRLEPAAALVDTLVMLLLVGTIAWRVLRPAPSALFPIDAPAPALQLPPAPGGAAPDDSPQPARVDTTGTAPEPPDAPAAPDPADDRLADALARAMGSERAYRDEGLSVATLARRLGVPEYRLRRVINQRRGHRNFNAYVNGFRLADAMAALADPAQRELPVLTIALTAGFQSIGPFNRAFKAATGVTPTEFRQQHRTDS